MFKIAVNLQVDNTQSADRALSGPEIRKPADSQDSLLKMQPGCTAFAPDVLL